MTAVYYSNALYTVHYVHNYLFSSKVNVIHHFSLPKLHCLTNIPTRFAARLTLTVESSDTSTDYKHRGGIYDQQDVTNSESLLLEMLYMFRAIIAHHQELRTLCAAVRLYSSRGVVPPPKHRVLNIADRRENYTTYNTVQLHIQFRAPDNGE
jgi:hypothetical protein